jgi:hypothetical protein
MLQLEQQLHQVHHLQQRPQLVMLHQPQPHQVMMPLRPQPPQYLRMEDLHRLRQQQLMQQRQPQHLLVTMKMMIMMIHPHQQLPLAKKIMTDCYFSPQTHLFAFLHPTMKAR